MKGGGLFGVPLRQTEVQWDDKVKRAGVDAAAVPHPLSGRLALRCLNFTSWVSQVTHVKHLAQGLEHRRSLVDAPPFPPFFRAFPIRQ